MFSPRPLQGWPPQFGRESACQYSKKNIASLFISNFITESYIRKMHLLPPPRVLSILCPVLFWASLIFYPKTAKSQTSLWINPNAGSWTVPSNWNSGTIPNGTTDAFINNGGMATLSTGQTGTTAATSVGSGLAGVTNIGSLEVDGTLTALGGGPSSAGSLFVGSDGGVGGVGIGSVTVRGALIITGTAIIGANSGSGSIVVESGLWSQSNGIVLGASQGKGFVTVTGGQLILAGDMDIGGGRNGNFEGIGSLLVTGGACRGTGIASVGAFGASSGTLTVSNGVCNFSSVVVGAGNGSRGIVTINGGQCNFDSLMIGGGVGSTGTTAINGGSITTLGQTIVGRADGSSTGILTVNALLSSPSILINPNGILNGTGALVGNLTNSGLVRPGNSVGTLTVNGNYTQTSSGTLAIQVADSTTASQLVVLGDANLDGTLLVETLPGFSFGFDMDVAIPILSAERVNGTFSTVELPPDFPFELVYTPNDVALVFNLEEAVMTETGLEILEDILAGVPIGEELDAELANLLLAEANLVPLPDIALKDILFNATNTQYNQITTRLAALRSGVNTVTLQGLPQTPSMVEQYNKRCGKKQIMTCEEEPLRWDIFANTSGIFSVMKTVGDLPKIRSTAGYFSAGADRRINQYFNVGIYVGYQGIRNWNNEDIWFRSNGVKWGLYGTAHWEGFYLNAIVGGGANFTNYNRAFHLMGKHHIARSNPFCGELDSLLGGGYEYRRGSWIFGANNSIQYTYLGINSSTESGAGHNLNAKLYRRNWSSLVYTLGGNISYLWEIAPNYQILPTIGLSWQHEFLNYGKRVHGAFANGAGAPFFINAPGGARNNAFGVAGITAQIGPRIGAYAYYTPQFGGGRIYSNAVLAGVNFNF